MNACALACMFIDDSSSIYRAQVLDLDETLVHCSVDPIVGADLTFPVEFNGANYTVFVRKRPYLQRFLEAVYEKFEVVIFTASQVRASHSDVVILCPVTVSSHSIVCGFSL
jgi:TFIIF-interacting CTD phosphatase-like protein